MTTVDCLCQSVTVFNHCLCRPGPGEAPTELVSNKWVQQSILGGWCQRVKYPATHIFHQNSLQIALDPSRVPPDTDSTIQMTGGRRNPFNPSSHLKHHRGIVFSSPHLPPASSDSSDRDIDSCQLVLKWAVANLNCSQYKLMSYKARRDILVL